MNRGLGHAFLKHVQRCPVLLLVLDGQQNMAAQLCHLQQELRLYDEQLLASVRLIVANKMDTVEGEQSDRKGEESDKKREESDREREWSSRKGEESGVDMKSFEEDLRSLEETSGLPVIPISALQHWNIQPLRGAIFRIFQQLH